MVGQPEGGKTVGRFIQKFLHIAVWCRWQCLDDRNEQFGADCTTVIVLRKLPDKQPAVEALADACNEYNGNPELINSTDKPSYRIAAALNVEAGAFKGNLIGNLAKEIGLPALRRSCHHFDQWLRQLETLA